LCGDLFSQAASRHDYSGVILNDKIELQKHDREFVRWLILHMLYAARPGGISDIVILRVLQNLDFDCQVDRLREDLDYLQSVGLAEAGHDDIIGYRAGLTRLGVAVVEYKERVPSGVGRPKKLRR
jgi:hypothetical protein